MLSDLEALYHDRIEGAGRRAARRWYWWQALLTVVGARGGGTDPPPQRARPRRARAPLDRLVQDLRFGWRLMRRKPAVTIVAVLTVAVGVGANLTVFTIINGTLLSPPAGVERPEELVMAYHSYDGQPMNIPYPRFVAYREQATSAFSGLAAYRRLPVHLRLEAQRLRVQGALVSGGYFDTLGLTPHRGRLLHPTDDVTPGGHPVAVISHGLWRRLGDGDDTVGHAVTINGHSFDVVGVAPAGFRGIEVGETTDVWVPAAMQRVAMPSDADRLTAPLRASSATFGRLREGVALEAAQELASGLAASLQQQQEVFAGEEVLLFDDFWVSPYLRDHLVEVNRVLAALVAVVLVLACANVANLLLAEALHRSAEVRVRRALGASRGPLLRQTLVEGMLLSACGGVAGVAAAFAATKLIAAFRLSPILALADINLSIDHRVLLATFVLTFVAGTAFSLLPALQMASGGRGAAPRTARRRSAAWQRAPPRHPGRGTGGSVVRPAGGRRAAGPHVATAASRRSRISRRQRRHLRRRLRARGLR